MFNLWLRPVFLATLILPMSSGASGSAQNSLLSVNHPIDVARCAAKLQQVAPNLNKKVLKLALTAYKKANDQGLGHKPILSVIDYSLPASKKSLWVFDMRKSSLLFNTLVAHGKGSGGLYATRFSNRTNSRMTSLGLYVTGKTYYGHTGYSLRIHGKSKGFNDKAYSRAVVMHGAWYVSPSFLSKHHRLGRSFGCPAVSKAQARPIIDTIKGGSYIFAYGNDANWLKHDPFIGSV